MQQQAPLAVVTGASSGIGLELARRLSERGHDVVICAEDVELGAAQRDLASTAGTEIHVVRADLATRSGVEHLVDCVHRLGRPVDVLALNAGIGVWGPFIETDLESDLRLLQLNVTAVVHLAKALVPGMVRAGGGRVLLTSSIAALAPGPWYATYAASKAFVYSFAEALRHELKDTGVTVTAVLPGPTDTEFFARAGMEQTVAGQGPKDDPADVAEDALEALFDGDHRTVAHARRNKVQAAGLRLAPEPVRAAAAALQTKAVGDGEPPTD
jgi:uncharacterized protein